MMRHTFNISIAALAVAAMSLFAAGCQKQNVQGDGTAYPLSFEISVGNPEIGVLSVDGTKADNRKTGTSTIENFTVAGYTDSAEWFPQTTVNTSSMTFSKLWLPGEEHTFYAYANLPASGATASIASDGVTLTYTAVPTSQASQQDILLGSYKGKGTNGTASIKFYHPLAAVAFKVGEISGVTKISSITLDGVYKSGSVKLSETSGTPAFAWTASTTQNGVQTSLNVTTFTTNTAIGDPFILIPQTFSSKPLTVKIALTTAEGDKTVTATLSTGSIAAGKTTTYAVNYTTAKGLNFTSSVTAWGSTGDPVELALVEEPQQPDNEIWYWTTDEQVLNVSSLLSTDNSYLGAKLLTNTYSDGKGILKFDGTVIQVGTHAFWSNPEIPISSMNSGLTNLLLMQLPPKCTSLKSAAFVGRGCTILRIAIPDEMEEINNPFYHMLGFWDGGTCEIITSTNTYRLVFYGGRMHLNDISGPSEFTVMPQNITAKFTEAGCFVKGTLVTLADGSQKKVEDLTYSDKLKVWNFDEGRDDEANILWLNKSGLHEVFHFKVCLSDGTVLYLVGDSSHRLFNYTDRIFQYAVDIAPGTEILTEHGLVTLVSCERIEEDVEYYNLITDTHFNCYINNVLSSCRYNNIYPIDQDMKFVKDGRKKRPYSEFKSAGISREWYNGMRLGEQTYDVEDVASYFEKCEAHMAEKPAPTFLQRFKTWWKSIFG